MLFNVKIQIILHLAGFAQASPDKSFAFAHAHAAARTRAAQSEQAMTGVCVASTRLLFREAVLLQRNK